MRCFHQNEGCVWEGGEEDLNLHLESCMYVRIDCAEQCGELVSRIFMADHNTVCQKKRIPCPNDCSVGYIIRGELETHLNHCELHQVPCPFNEAGCNFTGTQAMIQTHMEMFQKVHMLEMSKLLAKQASEIKKLMKEQRVTKIKMEALKDENSTMIQEMSQLNANLNEVRSELISMKSKISDSTFTWTIPDFKQKMKRAKDRAEEQIKSPGFYAFPNSYKLKATLHLNGFGADLGNYMSLYISLIERSYDEALKWPFTFKVKCSIMDQNPDASLAKNIDHIIDPQINERLGFPQFLSHTDLYSNYYIKNDTVIIKFTCIHE